MSILIKGNIKAPNNCLECATHFGKICEQRVYGDMRTCRFVEIPPFHGRLVDIDEVYKVLSEQYHHRTETQHMALQEALSKVPTIIEGEGR